MSGANCVRTGNRILKDALRDEVGTEYLPSWQWSSDSAENFDNFMKVGGEEIVFQDADVLHTGENVLFENRKDPDAPKD